MNIFNVETPIEFENGMVISFRTPTPEEIAWAHDVVARIRSLPAGTAERVAISSTEVPNRLPDLIVSAKFPGGNTLPADWKEQLHESGLLAGVDGVEILGRVCFRTRLKAEEPDPEGPKG